VGVDGVRFCYADRDHAVRGVSLYQEVGPTRPGPDLERDGGAWTTWFPRPAVDRMEYLFEVRHRDGGAHLVCDPANDKRAPGAFGDKSVVEFPGYQPPSWLAQDRAPDGPTRPLPDLQGIATGLLWSAPGTRRRDRLPLLVVHDGPEYAAYADLLVFLDRAVGDGTLPPMRAALLAPTGRDEQYSASPSYADALTSVVLPRLAQIAPAPPGRRFRVGMGASLGALAMLHAHRTSAASFGGLFLQSGSYFHHRYFRHELSFTHLERIRHFIDRMHASGHWDVPIPVVLSCGEVEMNFEANRATARALRDQGYPARFLPVRDAHTWVGWRDAFTPGLVDLLRELWR
jgi:enterochelin esterase family protein